MSSILSVLSRLIGCFYPDFAVHDDALLLALNFLLPLRSPYLHFAFKHFVLLLLLSELGLHLLKHLLLDHASETILHRVSCRLKGGQARPSLSLLLFKLPRNLRVKQDLNEATGCAAKHLFFRFFRSDFLWLDIFFHR